MNPFLLPPSFIIFSSPSSSSLSLSICLSFSSSPYLSDIFPPIFLQHLMLNYHESSWMKLGITRRDRNKIIPEGKEGRKERKWMEEDEIRKGGKSLSVSSLTNKAHSTDILFLLGINFSLHLICLFPFFTFLSFLFSVRMFHYHSMQTKVTIPSFHPLFPLSISFYIYLFSLPFLFLSPGHSLAQF